MCYIKCAIYNPFAPIKPIKMLSNHYVRKVYAYNYMFTKTLNNPTLENAASELQQFYTIFNNWKTLTYSHYVRKVYAYNYMFTKTLNNPTLENAASELQQFYTIFNNWKTLMYSSFFVINLSSLLFKKGFATMYSTLVGYDTSSLDSLLYFFCFPPINPTQVGVPQ